MNVFEEMSLTYAGHVGGVKPTVTPAPMTVVKITTHYGKNTSALVRNDLAGMNVRSPDGQDRNNIVSSAMGPNQSRIRDLYYLLIVKISGMTLVFGIVILIRYRMALF